MTIPAIRDRGTLLSQFRLAGWSIAGVRQMIE